MTFRLSGIDPVPFHPLFDLDDDALREMAIRRCIADSDTGFPCRASLEDARAGEEVLLLPYEHQPAASPYRASGPIFLRRGATRRLLPPGTVPHCVTSRLISLRAYDSGHVMVAAQVREGPDTAAELERMFSRPEVAYVHLHNAIRGCFSCEARRA